MAPESSFGLAESPTCGILEGAVTERWAPGDAAGGDGCVLLLSPSSSIGNGALSELYESCFAWWGLPLTRG